MTAKPTIQKLLSFSPDLAAQIAAYRSNQCIPTETEAVRQLITAGLAAAQPPRKDPQP